MLSTAHQIAMALVSYTGQSKTQTRHQLDKIFKLEALRKSNVFDWSNAGNSPSLSIHESKKAIDSVSGQPKQKVMFFLRF